MDSILILLYRQSTENMRKPTGRGPRSHLQQPFTKSLVRRRAVVAAAASVRGQRGGWVDVLERGAEGVEVGEGEGLVQVDAGGGEEPGALDVHHGVAACIRVIVLYDCVALLRAVKALQWSTCTTARIY